MQERLGINAQNHVRTTTPVLVLRAVTQKTGNISNLNQKKQLILLGEGTWRDKLYKYKSKLKTNIDNILDLDTSENYLALEEGSEAVLQENEIFIDELKGVAEYLTISCTRVLDCYR